MSRLPFSSRPSLYLHPPLLLLKSHAPTHFNPFIPPIKPTAYLSRSVGPSASLPGRSNTEFGCPWSGMSSSPSPWGSAHRYGW